MSHNGGKRWPLIIVGSSGWYVDIENNFPIYFLKIISDTMAINFLLQLPNIVANYCIIVVINCMGCSRWGVSFLNKIKVKLYVTNIWSGNYPDNRMSHLTRRITSKYCPFLGYRTSQLVHKNTLRMFSIWKKK